jgi:hypothetical protein
VEIAPPGIDGQDNKMHVPTHKWDPLVLCRIIEPFMTGTIQDLYHIGLVPKSMIYYSTVRDT